jgi:uncharacterized protein
MIPRTLSIHRLVRKGRVLLLYGARRVGKTTLLKEFLSSVKLRYRLESGDNVRVQELLSSHDFQRIFDFVDGYQLLAIDEAQQIPGIGQALKILVDQRPNLLIVATGSSSFELAQRTGEPLTGRKRTAILYPLSARELLPRWNRYELEERLEELLLFGTYPEIVVARSRRAKRELLNELVDSYLLKDVLSLERVKASRPILDLLRLLALQTGNLVSFNELATQVRLDVKTVARYVDILEKAFVIFRLGGYGRNLRKEITAKAKYYFYDTGVRNAIISQFGPLSDRLDVGALFENFVIMERLKSNAYASRETEIYFWRTYDGQEVDLVESQKGRLHGFEIKWSPRGSARPPHAWKTAYAKSIYKLVTPQNVLDFLLGPRRK